MENLRTFIGHAAGPKNSSHVVQEHLDTIARDTDGHKMKEGAGDLLLVNLEQLNFPRADS